jgi:spartin
MLECLALPRNATANLTTASGNVVKPNPFSDNPAPNQDLYLIMKSGDFEICLVPGVKMERQPSFEVSYQGGQGSPYVTFTVPSTTVRNAFVEIVIPRPSTEEDQQDLETYEILLKQYGVLHIPPQYVNREIPGSSLIESVTSASTPASPIGGKSVNAPPPIPPRPGMRHSASGGRFVLVDESTGQIVGELDQQLSVEEGKQVMGNSSSEPVVVDFGQLDAGVIGKITVKTIDEADMNDWMLKGAHLLSKGILSLGNSASSGITSAAEYYTKNTKPATEPVKLGSVTKGSIRTVHNVSTRGLKVTRKTLGIVQDVSCFEQSLNSFVRAEEISPSYRRPSGHRRCHRQGGRGGFPGVRRIERKDSTWISSCWASRWFLPQRKGDLQCSWCRSTRLYFNGCHSCRYFGRKALIEPT